MKLFSTAAPECVMGYVPACLFICYFFRFVTVVTFTESERMGEVLMSCFLGNQRCFFLSALKRFERFCRGVVQMLLKTDVKLIP